MGGRTIGLIRKFHCDVCKDSREIYITEGEAHPMCCGQAMDSRVEGRPTKSAIFPFVTTNIDGLGTPIEVESLHHARQLERQYGVVLSAFSQDSDHSREMRDLPRHRVGGREYESR